MKYSSKRYYRDSLMIEVEKVIKKIEDSNNTKKENKIKSFFKDIIYKFKRK
jgi:hypothetical protein